ncbi:unnamed protein product [Linum tenue]|uniref:Uncharacterized protein n=1 Tax=Linum tenue TaxID=586396 RepID=A0AAV0MEL1_9ROSI|nr:unnamed protein product [Linum tenue]
MEKSLLTYQRRRKGKRTEVRCSSTCFMYGFFWVRLCQR